MHSEPKVSVGKFRGVILPAVMLRGQGFGADRQVLSADFTPYRLTHRKLSLHGGIDRGLVEFWNAAAGDHALLVRTFFRHNSGKIRERSNGKRFAFAARTRGDRGLNCCNRRLRSRFNGAVAFQRRK